MSYRNEIAPQDSIKVMQMISCYHGPNRYERSAGTINGAVTLLESSEAFRAAMKEQDFSVPPDGPGAVWGWFVGSPRAFLFGYERTKSWAVRRMNQVLREEGRKLQAKMHERS